MRDARKMTFCCAVSSAVALGASLGCSASEEPSSAPVPVEASEPLAAAACSPLTISSIFANGNDGNVPSNAIDGNLNTRWSREGVRSYITVDLGSAKTVCGVNVAWYQGNTRRNNFVLSLSTNGSTFRSMLSGQSSGMTNDRESYAFTPKSARYVRVTVNGNTLNNWASITELQVPGEGGTPPTSS